MKKLGHQLMALKQRLAASEQENENLKLECDNLRHGQLKESKALLDKKVQNLKKHLVNSGLNSNKKWSKRTQNYRPLR